MSQHLDDRKKKIGFIYDTMTGFYSVMRNLEEDYKVYSQNYSEEALALLGKSSGFINSVETIRSSDTIRAIDEEGINELFLLSQQIAELYHLDSQIKQSKTEIIPAKSTAGSDNAKDRIEAIKKLLEGNVFNDKKNAILSYLNSFTDNELRIVQKDLYDLQAKIYKKLNFSQNKATRQFFNTHRKGLFVTKNEAGKILKLNYTPGNDVVFVNKKGELLEYFQYEEGSRAEFFGKALGIGRNRADWMMMVAGYDYSGTEGMNIPTTNTKRSIFSEFNIFGNELKSEISPEHKDDKIKYEVFKRYPEIYARFGDRICGINGKIIELDDGKGKVLGDVPYFHQCDNETVDGPKGDDNQVYGGVMCQLTSLAMILSSKGVKPKDSSKQLEDILYEIAKEEDFGYGKSKTLWDDPQNMYRKIIPKLKTSDKINCNELEINENKGSSDSDENFETIINQINKGNAVIVDIKYGTNKGHVITCIGYTENSLIVHDPYGNLEHGSNNGYGDNRDYNGAFTEYPKNKYELGKHWIKYLEAK